MLRMIISIDDLSDETKQVLTSWGNIQDIQVKELREGESAYPLDHSKND